MKYLLLCTLLTGQSWSLVKFNPIKTSNIRDMAYNQKIYATTQKSKRSVLFQDNNLPDMIQNLLTEAGSVYLDFVTDPESWLQDTIPGIADKIIPLIPKNQVKSDLSHIIKNQNNYKQLTDYGCWCNFNTGKYGHGIPKDHIDKACRKLWDNYACIDSSAKENGESCNSIHQGYAENIFLHIYVGAAAGLKSFAIEKEAMEYLNKALDMCEDNRNKSTCKRETCKAEVQWIYDILVEGLFERNAQIVDELNINAENYYSNDFIGLDQKTQCRRMKISFRSFAPIEEEKNKNKRPERKCCGSAPNYQKYNSEIKGCCSGKVYDINMSECNDDHVQGRDYF